MILISINRFADLTVRNKPGTNKAELVVSLKDALARKNFGAVCICCGNSIWAAGSAVTGSDMCFSCTTGEADSSEDYEVIGGE